MPRESLHAAVRLPPYSCWHPRHGNTARRTEAMAAEAQRKQGTGSDKGRAGNRQAEATIAK